MEAVPWQCLQVTGQVGVQHDEQAKSVQVWGQMAWIAATPVVVRRMSGWLIQITVVNLIFVHLKNNFRHFATFHIFRKEPAFLNHKLQCRIFIVDLRTTRRCSDEYFKRVIFCRKRQHFHLK